MKLKKISAIILASAAIITTANVAHGQMPPDGQGVPPQPGQMPPNGQGVPSQPGVGRPNMQQDHPEIPGLNLTEKQKTRLEQIHENTRSQLDQILTSEQKSKLQQGMQSGENPRQLMQSLNLSQDQKDKLKQAMKSEHQQMDNVLTTKQKQAISTWMKQHHPQGHPNGSN